MLERSVDRCCLSFEEIHHERCPLRSSCKQCEHQHAEACKNRGEPIEKAVIAARRTWLRACVYGTICGRDRLDKLVDNRYTCKGMAARCRVERQKADKNRSERKNEKKWLEQRCASPALRSKFCVAHSIHLPKNLRSCARFRVADAPASSWVLRLTGRCPFLEGRLRGSFQNLRQ